MTTFEHYYYIDESLKGAVAAGALGLASLTSGADPADASPAITFTSPSKTPIKVSPSPTYNPSFIQEVKEAENSVKAGWRGNKFYPYPSPEGGTATIGYGHKLTTSESKSGKYSSGLTEAEATALLFKDLRTSEDRLKRHLRLKYSVDYNTLKLNQKQILLDFTFNIGNVTTKFPKFTQHVLNKDKAGMIKEHERKYKDKKGRYHRLQDRNERTLRFIQDQF
jgi:GH24 family phage-related lysozyme (muramidase)